MIFRFDILKEDKIAFCTIPNMKNAKIISIADVMTKSVISVDASVTVNDAAKMMEDAKVGAVVIVENNIPIGIVTDRDFVKIIAHAYQITTSVKQIMSSPLYSIDSNESVRVAADLMRELGIRKLPVVDNNNVVGIITATDIVNLLSTCVEEDMRDMYFHSVVKIFSEYSPYN